MTKKYPSVIAIPIARYKDRIGYKNRTGWEGGGMGRREERLDLEMRRDRKERRGELFLPVPIMGHSHGLDIYVL